MCDVAMPFGATDTNPRLHQGAFLPLLPWSACTTITRDGARVNRAACARFRYALHAAY